MGVLFAAAAVAMTSFAFAAGEAKHQSSTPMAATGTRYKANADMQAVLDALASLHGKPIETLDGGGWVIADKEVYDGGARGLSKQANAVVVSVDYRRAPEARFPAQHDDALAAYQWVVKNAATMNADAARVALAGESAGGNLAIATAVSARDAGGPQPLHVVSVYPIAQVSDFDTPSYRDAERAKPLNKAMMQWFVDKTVEKPDDKKDWRLDLVHADLKGLPPVTLINARIDPLRSDGDMLASALKKAGVRVEHRIYDRVTHEFFGMAAVVAKAKQAQPLAGERLHQSFSAPARSRSAKSTQASSS